VIEIVSETVEPGVVFRAGIFTDAAPPVPTAVTALFESETPPDTGVTVAVTLTPRSSTVPRFRTTAVTASDEVGGRFAVVAFGVGRIDGLRLYVRMES